MKLLYSLFIAVCLSLLLAGCHGVSDPDTVLPAPAASHRLVIYTPHQEAVYGPIIREFEARTGIWVQVETGGTMELLERIGESSTEPSCDLLFGGGVETLEAHKELFTPYESPLLSQVDQAYQGTSSYWTPLSALPIVLIYNSKLVRLNPPSGWEDLLDDTWKGRIAYADPTLSASAFTALCTLLQVFPHAKPEQILKTFLQNLNREVLSSSGSVIEEVAHGNCYIGITLEDDALRSIENGYDIAMVYPKEGTSAVCDGIAIVAGCAHEDNARLFIDFILGEDVQSYLAENCFRRSILTGQPPLDATSPSFLSYDTIWASNRQSELLTLWKSLLQEVAP